MSKSYSKIKNPPNSKGKFIIPRKEEREEFKHKTLGDSFSFKKKDSEIKNKIISNLKTEKPNKLRIKRYKIEPNKFLQERFKECFDFSRFVYNKCVDHFNGNIPEEINKKIDNPEEPIIPSEEEVEILNKNLCWDAQKLLNNFGRVETSVFNKVSEISESIKKKYSLVPVHVIERVINEFITARNVCFTNLRNGNIRHFKMKFRLKKNKYEESFDIRHSEISPKKGEKFSSLFKTKWCTSNPLCIQEATRILEEEKIKNSSSKKITKIKTEEKMRELVRLDLPWKKRNPTHDCRIVRTFDNKYFIDVPRDVKISKDPNKQKIPVIALDPGVRTFLTGYDSNGNILTFGEKEDIENIRTKRTVSDWLQKGFKVTFDKNKRRFVKGKWIRSYKIRKQLKHKGMKMMRNSKNKIRTFHHQVSKYLIDNYDNIIIPKIETSRMIKKKSRKISENTVKAFGIWSHYNFRLTLTTKEKNRKTNVLVGTEEYTTQTCGHCFEKHPGIGKNKTFICPNPDCGLGYPIDRDENAARNILFLNWNEAKLKFSDS